MSTKRVLIQHPDGREYSIEPHDFTSGRLHLDKKSYAEQGFKIVSHADGSPYEGPTTLKEIEKAKEERQAAREVAKPATVEPAKPTDKAEDKGKA